MRPRPADNTKRKLFRPGPVLDLSELSHATIQSSLERNHQKGVYLPREGRDAGSIKVAGYLSNRALPDVRSLARIGDERLSLRAGATPDSYGLRRCPTKAQLQDYSYCTSDLTVVVECGLARA
jgi:hypothetical protein